MEGAVKLTKSVVDRLPFAPTGQQFYQYDTELPGFGVRVGSSSKTYVVERRVKGRTRRVTIGRHGVWTAEQARKRARELRVAMDQGLDPNAQARQEQALARVRGVTLSQVFEAYLTTGERSRSPLPTIGGT